MRCPSGAGPLRLRHKSDEHDVHGGENVSSLLVLAHAGVDTDAAASSSVLAPPLLPRCESPRCPEDFNNSGIAGRFPNGTDPCDAATTCVHDVFPGCTDYRGDSDSPVRAMPGRLSFHSFYSKSSFDADFVRRRRVLNDPIRWFPAWAVGRLVRSYDR